MYIKIQPITSARVPIVKFVATKWYFISSTILFQSLLILVFRKIECDVSLENILVSSNCHNNYLNCVSMRGVCHYFQALHNTRLLAMYGNIDSRVRTLGYVVKHFAKVRTCLFYKVVLVLIYLLRMCIIIIPGVWHVRCSHRQSLFLCLHSDADPLPTADTTSHPTCLTRGTCVWVSVWVSEWVYLCEWVSVWVSEWVCVPVWALFMYVHACVYELCYACTLACISLAARWITKWPSCACWPVELLLLSTKESKWAGKLLSLSLFLLVCLTLFVNVQMKVWKPKEINRLPPGFNWLEFLLVSTNTYHQYILTVEMP